MTEAERLAQALDNLDVRTPANILNCSQAAALLRSQAAELGALREQLASAQECNRELVPRAKKHDEEQVALRADAERGRYMLKHAAWHRGEERTYLAVLVPQGSDLSCYAMREAAIDAARQS